MFSLDNNNSLRKESYDTKTNGNRSFSDKLWDLQLTQKHLSLLAGGEIPS